MRNPTLKPLAVAVSSLLLLGSVPAHAGPDAVRAEAYFNAISGGDANTIASFYADDAVFHWVGGPLAGTYRGKEQITAVWDKFVKAAGELDHEVTQLDESPNGKVSTVTARVKFKGQGEVPVKFIMMFKDGKIASEVWQVDKPGTAVAKADAKASAPDYAPPAFPAPDEAAPEAAAPAKGEPAETSPGTDAAPTDAAVSVPTPGKAERKPAPEPKGKAVTDEKKPVKTKTAETDAKAVYAKPVKPKKRFYSYDGGYGYGGYGYGGYGYGGYRHGHGGYGGYGRSHGGGY